MASRILVVEDDDTQQFILKSALEEKGYVVDVAGDGLTALRMLRTGTYDLALVDYRIPEVDGLASAKLLHDMVEQGVRPKLLAITADSRELEARAGADGVFDAIIPKPFDLKDIIRLVDRELRTSPSALRAAQADAIWRDQGLARAPAAHVVPKPTVAQVHLLETLFDISGEREPDLVAIVSEDCADEIASLRENTELFRYPFIDMTSHFADIADGSLTDFDPKRITTIASTIRQFNDRWRRVSPTFQNPHDTESRLLCYLFLSGRMLHPVRFAQSKTLVRYAGFFSSSQVMQLAERLERRGLLQQAFFDRVHVCSLCESARLNVREECPSCRSSHLREEAIIHHFRCAHQAPESAFKSDRDLVCPKCRQHLRHYGSDYDKPGTAYICVECGHLCSDVAIGFLCFDCGAHMDGDAIGRRDIYTYQLTDEAIRMLTAQAVHAPTRLPSENRFPLLLNDELSRIAKDAEAKQITLAEISYGAEPSIVASRGRSGFERLRTIFLDNLRGALSSPTELYSGQDRDFLLAHKSLSEIDERLLKYCQESLVEPLEPKVRQVDPFDMSSGYERSAIGH